jgi:hypothetical protein
MVSVVGLPSEPVAASGHTECLEEGEVWDEDAGQTVIGCKTWKQTEQVDDVASSGEPVCYFQGEPLASCYGPERSYWNGTCYVGPAVTSVPQAEQEGPNGESVPDEGQWRICYLPTADGEIVPGVGVCPVGAGLCVWVPAGEQPTVNPVDLAWQAIARLSLEPIEVGIVPESGEDRLGLVGLPTWMWVSDPGDATWGPVTASASDGPVSVSITARARQVFWDMGDGNIVVCGKGIPYDRSYGIAESPNCGHRYEQTSVDQPDEAYQVVATTQWVVEWSGGGMTGRIEFDLASDPVPIRIGEMQVLVQ